LIELKILKIAIFGVKIDRNGGVIGMGVHGLNQAQKTKISLKLEYLQEYSSAVIADNSIKRYFNTLRVNFVLNKKENQTEWILN
jgi:hypothetical protein